VIDCLNSKSTKPATSTAAAHLLRLLSQEIKPKSHPATSTLSPPGPLTANSPSPATAPPDPDATYNTDIWTASANNTDKGAHFTQVTTNPGIDNQPMVLDGQSIAYVTMLDPKLSITPLAISPSPHHRGASLTLSPTATFQPHFFGWRIEFIGFLATTTANKCSA
jgi:hypothetical protein